MYIEYTDFILDELLKEIGDDADKIIRLVRKSIDKMEYERCRHIISKHVDKIPTDLMYDVIREMLNGLNLPAWWLIDDIGDVAILRSDQIDYGLMRDLVYNNSRELFEYFEDVLGMDCTPYIPELMFEAITFNHVISIKHLVKKYNVQLHEMRRMTLNIHLLCDSAVSKGLSSALDIINSDINVVATPEIVRGFESSLTIYNIIKASMGRYWKSDMDEIADILMKKFDRIRGAYPHESDDPKEILEVLLESMKEMYELEDYNERL